MTPINHQVVCSAKQPERDRSRYSLVRKHVALEKDEAG